MLRGRTHVSNNVHEKNTNKYVFGSGGRDNAARADKDPVINVHISLGVCVRITILCT